MTQAICEARKDASSASSFRTAVKPVLEVKTCATCPYFDNFQESNGAASEGSKVVEDDDMGAYALRWCKLFDHQAREYHEITNDCITSSDFVVSHELEDNLDLFPNVDFEELDAFPTKKLEDELDQPYSEYQEGSIVKVIDKDERHEEWGIFKIVECKYNKSLCDNTESYLNEAAWYFRLAGNDDATTINKSLWVREDEICHFDMSHNICTDDIF